MSTERSEPFDINDYRHSEPCTEAAPCPWHTYLAEQAKARAAEEAYQAAEAALDRYNELMDQSLVIYAP